MQSRLKEVRRRVIILSVKQDALMDLLRRQLITPRIGLKTVPSGRLDQQMLFCYTFWMDQSFWCRVAGMGNNAVQLSSGSAKRRD